jgi:hypothetical protein
MPQLSAKYTSNQFEAYLKPQGIAHQTSTPHTTQQNGVAERANCTIVEMARSMIYGQGLGLEFRAQAVSNAVYIRNRCPTSAVHGKTQKEAWYGRKPSVAHIRVFRCIAYAKIPVASRTKLEAKSVKCLFLGYCEGTKAYIGWFVWSQGRSFDVVIWPFVSMESCKRSWRCIQEWVMWTRGCWFWTHLQYPYG